MTVYYVRKTGNDSNAGTSAGAAYLTIEKALSVIVAGDTVWIGAGHYPEVATSRTYSFASETKILGDVTGVNTGDPGVVVWSAYVSGRSSAPSSSPLFTATELHNVTIEDIYIRGSAASEPCFAIADCGTFTMRRCIVNYMYNAAYTLGAVHLGGDVGGNQSVWTFERCVFWGDDPGRAGLYLSPADHASEASIRVENCIIHGGAASEVQGSLTFDGTYGTPSGIEVVCNTFLGGTIQVGLDDSGWPAGAVVTRGNIHAGCRVRNYDSDDVDGIDEDWNIFMGKGGRYNTAAGANTKVVGSQGEGVEHFGASILWPAGSPKPWFAPLTGDEFYVNWVGESVVTMPTEDFAGNPRPLNGALLTAGAFELAGTATENTSPPAGSGAQSWKFTGSGIQEFDVAVDDTLTTISVAVQWDATYTGTKPSLSILRGGEAGVDDDTDTATGSSGSWESLTLSFTPTSKGVITVRFQSEDTNGAGITDFSNYTFSG